MIKKILKSYIETAKYHSKLFKECKFKPNFRILGTGVICATALFLTMKMELDEGLSKLLIFTIGVIWGLYSGFFLWGEKQKEN